MSLSTNIFKAFDTGCIALSMFPVVRESTGSALSFQDLEAWIEACKDHEHCPPVESHALPTRVLDVYSRNQVRLLSVYTIDIQD
jgi:hypothetical protein